MMMSATAAKLPLGEQIRWARRHTFCGQLTVRRAGEALGLVVFHQGRVAWAVCRRQPETLGRFLRRLGRVTREQLDEVQQRYEACGRRRKIGALLEEAGMIRRPVLRRCLLLHTRMALESLLEPPGGEAIAHPGHLEVDPEMTFSLEELMPTQSRQAPAEAPPSTRWRTWNRENRFLEPLAQIAGYRASALVDADGEVRAAHAAGGDLDVTVLGVYLAAVLESASRAAASSALGQVEFALLDCTDGALVARWLDERRSHLVVVLVAEDGQIGAAKYGLRSALDDLRAAAATRH
jgi:predicted regulator of Ras-like GTPase activity (Roadblock/LC7/MglB family)